MSCRLFDFIADFFQQADDLMLRFEELGHKLLGRPMSEIVGVTGVLEIEIEAICLDISYRNSPGSVVLASTRSRWASPPTSAVSELLEPQGLCLGVLLPTGWWQDFVEPNLFRPPGFLKEDQVRRNLGVRGEHAIR
jgi:hypothetical protein